MGALSTLSVSGYSNFHYFIVVWSSTLLSQQLQLNTQLLPRCSLHLHSLICCSDSFFLSKAVKMMPVGRGIIKKLRKFNNLFKSDKKLQDWVAENAILVDHLYHKHCYEHSLQTNDFGRLRAKSIANLRRHSVVSMESTAIMAA